MFTEEMFTKSKNVYENNKCLRTALTEELLLHLVVQVPVGPVQMFTQRQPQRVSDEVIVRPRRHPQELLQLFLVPSLEQRL